MGKIRAKVIPDDETLRDFIAQDIWAHAGHARCCGPYEPCQSCLDYFYRPAADAVLATINGWDFGSNSPQETKD